ncbi:MAG: Gfo/Idh/MocA family oxidoreductase [Alphaproteobacteria bacterium]|nr:Gfo/Idh/MocA family oxidoreductase [Alphaproteobacteria bacterium]
MKLLIIGAGNIAHAYIAALKSLGYRDIDILSRRAKPAQEMAEGSNIGRGIGGGIETLRKIVGAYDGFIIAVPPETLMVYLAFLSDQKASRILVEKPVALSSKVLGEFLEKFPKSPARVALNRLYYPSVDMVRHHLIEDGGATSCLFSFCEWVHRIPPDLFGAETMARLGIANSIHIIATVFDVIGMPKTMSREVAGQGEVDWHPSGAVYVGSGLSTTNVPFAYYSDWLSAGRWSMTFRSRRGAYILEPIEGLKFCPRGSIKEEDLLPPDSGSIKCGFAEMLSAWLSEDGDDRNTLPRLHGYLESVEHIMNYPPDSEMRS